MNRKAFYILVMAMVTFNVAIAQSEPSSKSSKTNNLFIGNGSSGPYAKSGEALYPGILIEDEGGKPRVANVDSEYKRHFENGDVILSLNNTSITSKKDWEKALKQFKEGDKVKINIERGSKQLSVEVLLETISIYKSVI
jgi:S1-C subfamily serine protease